MKNYIKFLLLAMSLFGLNSNAQQPVTVSGGSAVTQAPTVSQIADAFVARKADYYRGSAYFNGTNNLNFTIQWIGGFWGFTQMNINGRELPIDPQHPLWTLPAFKGDVLDFGFYVQGYNANGQQTRYGNFYSQKLAPGDEIKVIIYLNYVRKDIPFTLPPGHNPQNSTIRSADGQYNGWYDVNSGAWIVYFDPINPPTSWVMIDTRNGQPFGDPIVFVSGPGNLNTSNGVVLENQERIPELRLNTADYYLQRSGLLLDHTIELNKTNYAGKIMIASVSAKTDYVQFYASNLRVGSVLQVFGYDATGKAVFITQKQLAAEWNDLFINNITGYADYKFIIIGAVSDPIAGLRVTAYDTSYSWYVDDGGIKGKQ